MRREVERTLIKALPPCDGRAVWLIVDAFNGDPQFKATESGEKAGRAELRKLGLLKKDTTIGFRAVAHLMHSLGDDVRQELMSEYGNDPRMLVGLLFATLNNYWWEPGLCQV